jgi:hypothetical protein
MRLFFRILKVIAVLIITLTIALFTASFLMQDRVAGIILRSLNKSISTKYEFESVGLSFLRKFPNASLDLKNVIVHSSPGFDRSAFPGIDTDTLLTAKSVFIEFSIADIYHGIYNIERIGVREGLLKLLTDTAGMVNYDIAVETGKETNSDFTIALNKISVTDIKAYYNNLAIKLEIAGILENGQLMSRISENEIDFTAVSSLQVTDFRLYNTRIAGTIPAEIDINLQSYDSGVVFNKGSLKLDKYLFSVKGFISSDDMLDLSLTGENLDIQGIKKYIPEEFLKKIADYDPAGVLQVKSNVKGLMSRTSYPGIEIRFLLNDGSVTLIDKLMNVNGVSLSGFFSNGSGHIPETSLLEINNFKGNLGSAQYSGSFSLSNFDSMNGMLQLKGKVIPSELKDFFRIKAISSSKGSIDLDLKMEGALQRREKYSLQDFIDMDPDVDLVFNSFSIGLKNDRILVSQVNGNLVLKDSVTANDLRFKYKDHKFVINGIFKKLPEWLAGKPEVLVASASVRCDNLMPESFFTLSSAADSSSKREKAYSLPSDIILDLNFVIDTLSFRQFNANKIRGSLSYKPRLVNFKTLILNSLDGTISCNGFIVQNPDKSFDARGSFDFEEVNINSAFRAFNNFGQDFLKAENINGNLSGSLTLLLPADSLWKIDIKSINGEGKYVITDGALIDFEPVKQLSAFIELSELENISFEKLENDFFIRNNFLYIPLMDVNSNAADLSVNGKHSFDNDYEYHVKIQLSEILSKKLKKLKPNTTEFGAIKDDGLGRTSVLLKIENKGEEVKVGYDVKAAGNVIKNDIRTERQTLKTILNEEYGWFKNDTAVTEKPAATTPRFKITWDETDTVSVETEEEQPEQNNVLKNLLKKRR